MWLTLWATRERLPIDGSMDRCSEGGGGLCPALRRSGPAEVDGGRGKEGRGEGEGEGGGGRGGKFLMTSLFGISKTGSFKLESTLELLEGKFSDPTMGAGLEGSLLLVAKKLGREITATDVECPMLSAPLSV